MSRDAREHTLNLSAVARQLGQRNPFEVPQLGEQILRVLPVSDLTELAPLANAPGCLAGSLVAAVAGEFGTYEITAADPGGTVVTGVTLVGGAGGWGLTIRPAAVTFLSSTAVNFGDWPSRVGPRRTQVRSGTAAAIAGLVPFAIAIAEPRWFNIPLQPGTRLILQSAVANQAVTATMILRDCPAAAGA